MIILFHNSNSLLMYNDDDDDYYDVDHYYLMSTIYNDTFFLFGFIYIYILWYKNTKRSNQIHLLSYYANLSFTRPIILKYRFVVYICFKAQDKREGEHSCQISNN